jgi:hypothetical protein
MNETTDTLPPPDRPSSAPLSSGADLIAAERRRQIDVEGWGAANDDGNTCYELLTAAAIYISSSRLTLACARHGVDAAPAIESLVADWPRTWHPKWFKSTTAIRDLVKAGALIAAEIDRLQRKGS